MIEGSSVEFKREFVEDIRLTVLAFANTDGGTLYIGVENDGTVRGVDDPDGTMLRVTNTIRDSIRPDVTLFTKIGTEEIEGKTVVTVSVQRGTARPYYLGSKGIRPEGVYVRQGASTVPASETAILQMIRETGGDRYEDTRSLNQQLTFEAATAFFGHRAVAFGSAQKRSLHLVGEDGTYTNLALLLSDQCVHSVKLAVFEGTKKAVFHDRRELSGSLLSQLEEAYNFIDRNNRTRAEFSGLDRIDRRDYPEDAIREALLNAVVHREYAMSGPILVSIFDDRMEIVSIGGLVPGLSVDDMMLGVSECRNPHLANVFYRLHLIEAYGTGMMKIFDSYADEAVKPEVSVTGNAFKITLPNVNYRRVSDSVSGLSGLSEEKPDADTGRKLTPRQKQALAFIRRKGSVTRKELIEELDASEATIGIILRRLKEDGLIVGEGNTRGMVYMAKG